MKKAKKGIRTGLLLLAAAGVLAAVMILPLYSLQKRQNETAANTVNAMEKFTQSDAPGAKMQQNELAMALYHNKQTLTEKDRDQQQNGDPPEEADDYMAQLKPCYDAAVKDVLLPLETEGWYWLYTSGAHTVDPHGNWLGAEFRSLVKRVEGVSYQAVDAARERKTGQYVYIAHTYSVSNPGKLEEKIVDSIRKNKAAQKMAAGYLQYLGFDRSDFSEVPETELTQYYRSLAAENDDRCMLYSEEYQLYLFCTMVAEPPDEERTGCSILLTLGVCSLTKQELQQVLYGTDVSGSSECTFAAAEPTGAYQTLLSGEYTPQEQEFWYGTPAGAYGVVNRSSGTGKNLVYADEKSEVLSVLCARPGCAHSSTECPAFYTGGKRVTPFVQQDRLYLLELQQEPAQLTITQMDLNGTEPQKMLELSGGDVWGEELIRKTDGASFGAVLYDGKKLTVSTLLSNYPHSRGTLVEIDPQSGVWQRNDAPAQAMQQQNNAVFQNLMGGWDDYLVVWDEYFRHHVLKADGSVDQMLTSKTYLDGQKYEYWHAAASGLYAAYQSDSEELFRYDPESRRMQAVGKRNDSSSDLYFSWSSDLLGNMFFGRSCYRPGITQGDTLEKITLISRIQVDDAVRDVPLSILAPVGEDTLLAYLRNEESSRFSMDQYGKINDEKSYRAQYAFISRQDYQNGVPNYRLIENT